VSARAGRDADVLVVGAGPAGSAVACLLARRGFDVLLVDRRAFPRPKPCGDCLSPQASRVLERLGALPEVLAARPARLDGWRIVGPRGGSFEERFASVCAGDAMVASALAIERARLDAILLALACAAGARFLAPVHVTALGPYARGGRSVIARQLAGQSVGYATRSADIELRARLVIGADGLRSRVAAAIDAIRRPPRRRKLSLTGHLHGIRDAGPLGEMHVGDGFCAGVAPVTSGADPLCNITLVAEAGRFGRAAAADPVGFWYDMLGRLPALAGRGIDSPLAHPLLASGPFDRPTRRVIADGVALVGDAAGYFDPFTGQGIHQALAGAELLAGVAARALARCTTAPALADYARAHARTARPAHRLQRVLDEVLARPAFADAAIRRLAHRPRAARALLAATGDLRSAGSLLSPGPLFSFAGPRWMERL
jgi:flavin-dependent dehydrogenase